MRHQRLSSLIGRFGQNQCARRAPLRAGHDETDLPTLVLHKASRFAAAALYFPTLFAASDSAKRGAARASVYSLFRGALHVAWLLVEIAFDFLTWSARLSPTMRSPPAIERELFQPAPGGIRVGPITPGLWTPLTPLQGAGARRTARKNTVRSARSSRAAARPDGSRRAPFPPSTVESAEGRRPRRGEGGGCRRRVFDDQKAVRVWSHRRGDSRACLEQKPPPATPPGPPAPPPPCAQLLRVRFARPTFLFAFSGAFSAD